MNPGRHRVWYRIGFSVWCDAWPRFLRFGIWGLGGRSRRTSTIPIYPSRSSRLLIAVKTSSSLAR
jgi:hypothetical protein